MKEISLGEIAEMLGCPMPRTPQRMITGVSTLAEAGPTELSYLSSEAYLKQYHVTKAAAVIVPRSVKLPPGGPVLLAVEDADLAVAKVLERFAPEVPHPPVGVDPLARVAQSAVLGTNVAIGPFVVIGQRSRIGSNCRLHPGVVIGDDVTIGDDCELFPNVVVRERITIGNRVIIHAGSVLGSDGFGYRWDGARHAKIPQIGTVIIEDDVEIGSCVCIDRAKFSATRIGQGTKIDNLVQIGHNCRIGPHCIIVGQAGLAGSVTLGTGVVLAGQSAVRDHVTMGDHSKLGACSGVLNDVPPGMMVSGLPALPHRQSLREQAALRQLPALRDQVRKLQAEIEELKKAK